MGQLHIRKMSIASAFKLWSRAGQGDLSYISVLGLRREEGVGVDIVVRTPSL